MKSFFHKLLSKLLICLLCFSALFRVNTEEVEAAVIKLKYTAIGLEVGATKTLSVLGTKKKVSWSSSKKSVATVSSGGKVTAKAVGTATIYASVAGKKLSAKVTVKAPIKLNYTSFKLEKGGTKQLKVTGTSSKVTWSSSKSSVAAVSTSGKVTAKATGTATIYAAVNGKKLSAKVSVTKTSTAVPTPTPIPEKSPTITPVPTTPDTKNRTHIVGYYAAWGRYSGFTPDKLDAGKLSHINYAFANISSDLKIEMGYPDVDEANIRQLNDLKK